MFWLIYCSFSTISHLQNAKRNGWGNLTRKLAWVHWRFHILQVWWLIFTLYDDEIFTVMALLIEISGFKSTESSLVLSFFNSPGVNNLRPSRLMTALDGLVLDYLFSFLPVWLPEGSILWWRPKVHHEPYFWLTLVGHFLIYSDWRKSLRSVFAVWASSGAPGDWGSEGAIAGSDSPSQWQTSYCAALRLGAFQCAARSPTWCLPDVYPSCGGQWPPQSQTSYHSRDTCSLSGSRSLVFYASVDGQTAGCQGSSNACSPYNSYLMVHCLETWH